LVKKRWSQDLHSTRGKESRDRQGIGGVGGIETLKQKEKGQGEPTAVKYLPGVCTKDINVGGYKGQDVGGKPGG